MSSSSHEFPSQAPLSFLKSKSSISIRQKQKGFKIDSIQFHHVETVESDFQDKAKLAKDK